MMMLLSSLPIVLKLFSVELDLFQAAVVKFMKCTLKSDYDVLRCCWKSLAFSSEGIAENRSVLISAIVLQSISEWISCAEEFLIDFI
jgi:hypothetical protein